jgi:hypothetical protein
VLGLAMQHSEGSKVRKAYRRRDALMVQVVLMYRIMPP